MKASFFTPAPWQPVQLGSLDKYYATVIENKKKGQLRIKQDFFLPFSNCHHFKASKSPTLLAWFTSSLGLLLHRFSYSKLPVPSGEPPKWGITWKFSNAINALALPPRKSAGITIHSECRMTGKYYSRQVCRPQNNGRTSVNFRPK